MTGLCLIDTGAFYALADESDRNAKAAVEFFRQHLDVFRFATTDAVVFESWTLIHHRLGWNAARKFLDGIKRSGISLFYIEPVDLELASHILDDYADQKLSLTDASSFAVMERQGVGQAFTFDKDFLLYRYGPKKQRSFTCRP